MRDTNRMRTEGLHAMRLGSALPCYERDMEQFRSGQLGNEDEVNRLFGNCGCLYMLGFTDGRAFCQWAFWMAGRLLRLPGGH